MVLEAELFPKFWSLTISSILVGFGTLYSVVYSSLETRRKFAYVYGIIAIIFVLIHFFTDIPYTPMNWGWVVIAISALSNIRRITQKIESKKSEVKETDVSKMYREDLEQKIQVQEKEIFDLRLENIKLKEK
jgi:hypothetical protein